MERLQSACVIVIGAGGVGSPLIPHLAGSGVGRVVIADFDAVSVSNLHRQCIHTEIAARSSMNKAESAASFCRALNSEISVRAVTCALDASALRALIDEEGPAAIIDCTDNAYSRYSICDAASQTQTPLLSVSAIRDAGQYCWLVKAPDGRALPCRRCLASSPPRVAHTAATAGVLGPAAAAVASLAAAELIMAIAEPRSAKISAGSMVAMSFERGGPKVRVLKMRGRMPECACVTGQYCELVEFKNCPNTPVVE